IEFIGLEKLKINLKDFKNKIELIELSIENLKSEIKINEI
ncbi:MAG: hypothetical protein K1060chlam4_00899, partial [Candidatus Anoxychlamydiales bacterium]|nr:hypothetical protein [Candidatus Anoxychlamydiales bacterium]